MAKLYVIKSMKLYQNNPKHLIATT